MAYSFGEFTVDPLRLEVRRGAVRIPLRPQAFDVLLLLASEAHRVVSKVELLGHVWKGNRVTENALSQCVREIRRALHTEDGAPEAVQTVRGRGFRLTAAVTRTRSSGEEEGRVPVMPFGGFMLVARGLSHFHRRTPADNRMAIAYLERAQGREGLCSPGPAYYLGLAHCNDLYYQWRALPEASLRGVQEAADECRRIAPGDASGHVLDALRHLFSGCTLLARLSAELSVRASPENPETLALLGRVLAVSGEGDAAVAHIRAAMGMSPEDLWPSDFSVALSMGTFAAGRYAEAAEHADAAVREAPRLLSSHVLLAASRGMLGDVDAAVDAGGRVRELGVFSAAPFRGILASSPRHLEARFFEGLSRAGLGGG